MALVYIIYLILILLEVWRNFHIIEKEKKRPDYLASTVLRFFVGLVFWFCFLWSLDFDHWIVMPFMMMFTFWWLFPLLLNISRNEWGEIKPKRPVWYVNKDGSWLDKMEYRIFGPNIWFIFKFFLMLAGIWIFQNSLNSQNYNWLRL